MMVGTRNFIETGILTGVRIMRAVASPSNGRPEPVRCDEALARVFSLLGKRWTGVVVGVLLERPARFGEITRAIPGITEGMLSARLGELQNGGLVEREVLPGPPIASVYRLTERGQALRPALAALGEWARDQGYVDESR
jgi:DNA-binding HxlR family transcriptional regulator